MHHELFAGRDIKVVIAFGILVAAEFGLSDCGNGMQVLGSRGYCSPTPCSYSLLEPWEVVSHNIAEIFCRRLLPQASILARIT